MAETAVRSLMENLSHLLEYHSNLISGAENELRWLMMDLDLLRAHSGDAAMNPEKVGPLGEIAIKELVYELEDAVDACLTDARNMNSSLQGFGQGHMLAEKVKDLTIRHVREPLDSYLKSLLLRTVVEKTLTQEQDLADVRFTRLTQEFRTTRSDGVIVGFEDEEETIIGYLTKPNKELDVISIIGTHGLGKTTLAWKINQNERISYEFPIRIWTHVARNSKCRDVSLNILKMFSSQDMSSMNDEELFETVRACLEKEKFLLFLDGVYKNDWKGIQNILPHGNGRSKVLITSCDDYFTVIEKTSQELRFLTTSHKLRFLTTEESWKLLQLEVFGNLEDCPPALTKIGQDIAGKCGGLPMQIVVVGGILFGQLMKSGHSKKNLMNADALGQIELEWWKVFENENLFVHNKQSISDAVKLIYSTLPCDLRECFLYMGVFPEGYEISVWTLTRLWIAEGFIRPEGGQSLEETATQKLYDLVSRNLVMIAKVNLIGEVKTCRVHDMVRAFCIYEAREQKVFQEIKRPKEGLLCRRLFAHSNVDTLLSELPKIPSVRSFLCFSKELVCLGSRDISSISDAFILLRVLDSKSIKCNGFPTRIIELIHLRYITLSVDDLHALPQSLSKLWNLQTLVVDTTSHLITMEANIWSLIWLRHVKTNAAIVLSSEEEGKAGENLQTLHMLSPESCTEDVSKRARNLRTLSIRGELATLFKSKFLKNLVRLEKLKLVNDLAYQNLLQGLPRPNCFPPNLKWLTLSNTFLKWNHISTLAEINTLEVLKLKDNAFTGIYWSVEEGGFRSLQFLLIANADLVIWEASTDSLPRLGCLVLKNCRNLNEFPVALKSLEKLEIQRVNKSAVTLARRIAEQKSNSGCPFKLSIAPG